MQKIQALKLPEEQQVILLEGMENRMAFTYDKQT
jgi:hypothetical protein